MKNEHVNLSQIIKNYVSLFSYKNIKLSTSRMGIIFQYKGCCGEKYV